MARTKRQKRNLKDKIPPEQWRYSAHNGAMLCLARGNTCKRLAMANGCCYFDGGASITGVDHPSYKTGRFSNAFMEGDLRNTYHKYVTDTTGNEIREAMSVMSVLIATDIKQLGSPIALWQTAIQGWRDFQAAAAMQPPVRGVTELEKEFASRMDSFNVEQQAMLRAATINIEKALKGGEDDAEVRDRLSKNAEKLARMSDKDASRQLKLKQTVQLEYVNTIILEIEAWRQEVMNALPADRRAYFARRFKGILEPSNNVLAFPAERKRSA